MALAQNRYNNFSHEVIKQTSLKCGLFKLHNILWFQLPKIVAVATTRLIQIRCNMVADI